MSEAHSKNKRYTPTGSSAELDILKDDIKKYMENQSVYFIEDTLNFIEHRFDEFIKKSNACTNFITKNTEEMEQRFNQLKHLEKLDNTIVNELFSHSFSEIQPIQK